MTRSEAKQTVEDMLLVCQKLRSDIDDAELGLAAILGPEWDPETVKRATVDMYSWLYGAKDIRPTLIDLLMGQKPITGLGVFNLMVIAHRLCPAISWLAPLRLPEGRDLPEPDIAWCVGELEE